MVDKADRYKSRIDDLERCLRDYRSELEVLSDGMSSVASGRDIEDLARDIAITENKIRITEDALAENKRLLQAEYDRQASPGYKQVVRSMSEIIKDNGKRVNSIKSQVDELISSLDDLDKSCNKYYQLSRQIGVVGNIRMHPDLARLWLLQKYVLEWEADLSAYDKHKSLGKGFAS